MNWPNLKLQIAKNKSQTPKECLRHNFQISIDKIPIDPILFGISYFKIWNLCRMPRMDANGTSLRYLVFGNWCLNFTKADKFLNINHRSAGLAAAPRNICRSSYVTSNHKVQRTEKLINQTYLIQPPAELSDEFL